MTRLFFALDINPQDKRAIATWRQHYLALPYKAIAEENFHITLAFLGEVSTWQQQALIEHAGKLAHHIKVAQNNVLHLTHCGLFKKPQVLFLGLTDTPMWLKSLAAQLSEKAIQLGISQEQRPYCPHISLYRKAKTPESHLSCNLTLEINSFSLYQSISTANGVQYRALSTWLLTKPV